MGANALTIAGGHGLDVLSFILGEFVERCARVGTRISEWRLTDTGETASVEAPDTAGVVGLLAGGCEVAAQVASVPGASSGWRMEIYGSEGGLHLTAPFNVGAGQIH